jgi:hypothetical protein
MRISQGLLVAAGLISVDAIHLVKRTDGAPLKVVEHAIERNHVADPVRRDQNRRRKRDNTLTVTLNNQETLYFMKTFIGTPVQKFRLQLDTGSSDLWVNEASSKLCSSKGRPCSISGTYYANDSSTYQYINSKFNITYVDGTGSRGDYVTDSVQIGGVTLEDQQFGVGYVTTSQEGIMGIGYPINEVAAQYAGGKPYPNVPQNLVNHGLINTNAYSLWLNDLDASTGSILFGGVNTEKYVGSLQTLPIIKEQGVAAEFIIALTSIGTNGNTTSIASNLATPALLDSGSSLMYLPNDITQSIYDSVDASYDKSQGAAFVDCALASSPGTLDFTFSGPTIQVPWNELVIVAGTERGRPVCILGIGPAGASTPVLGDTFLRSAYVVYDMERDQISLAQTNFNSSSDDILEIEADAPGVPGATEVPNPVTSVDVQSGGARIGGGGTTMTLAGPAVKPTGAPVWNVAAIGVAAAGAMFAL